MAVPLVNPVSFQVGSTYHLTPVDQNGAPIPIAQCTLANLPANVTATKDTTGFVLSASSPGNSIAITHVTATDGTTSVNSANFSFSIAPMPYAVTAVGTVSP